MKTKKMTNKEGGQAGRLSAQALPTLFFWGRKIGMHKLNEMMDRAIVKEEVLDFMRQGQTEFPAPLKAIEEDAHERRVPIIPHETAVFLDFFLSVTQAKEILEIGTAIAFSASLMTYGYPDRHVDTIDRYDLMIQEAQQNIGKLGLEDQIQILQGEAAEILPQLTKNYDFIFMDSAKSKYYEFFPYCLDRLKLGGVLMIDDIFQGGTIFKDPKEVPRRNRGMNAKLNRLLEACLGRPELKTSLLPLGDGVLMVQKLQDTDHFNYMKEG